MYENLDARGRREMRLHFRREILKNLGWTIIADNAVYPPGEDPDDATRIPNLVVAARDAGLPDDVDELSRWARGSRQVSGIIHEARERLYALGWTIVSDREIYAPGQGADEATWTLPTAAAKVGFPEIERFYAWAGRRDPARHEVAGTQARVDAPEEAPEPVSAFSSDRSVTFAPVEEHITERASFSQHARERQARRIESGLVQRFAQHLRQLGHEPTRIDIPVDGEVIRVDLFDRTTGVLYEAKASPDRQKIRMAIGQLLDYRRFLMPQPRVRVLVPVRPNSDLCRLLAANEIGATWPEGEGWQEMGPDDLAMSSAATNTER